ncbi:MAG: lytic transglycosylase domain-containing protein [Azoarcus sp.]|jgi:soluble lytic murein transglycosylase|nr:lytic transglycosylase domain-containing protein [Azoarcus sp.]
MFDKTVRALAAVVMVCCLTPTARAQAGDPFAEGEARFLAARDALRSGDRDTLESLANSANGHPLDAYVRYWLLSNGLSRLLVPPSADELNAFLRAETGTYLTERLRADWLRRLAKDSDWDAFFQIYPGLQNPDGEMRCLAWNGRLARGDRQVLDEVAASWDSFTFVNGTCAPVLRAAVSRGKVSTEAVWQLFRRRADTRSPSRASAVLDWLDGSTKTYNLAIRNPSRYLARLPKKWARSRAGREIALAAVARIARQDTGAAHTRFQRISGQLTASERAHGWATLALRAAQEHKPIAATWQQNAGSAPLNATQRAWRVRTALRDRNWQAVLAAIDKLKAEERALPEWIYWRGRALQASGRTTQANAAFGRIAAMADFYGILANEELGHPFDPRASHTAPTAAEIESDLTDRSGSANASEDENGGEAGEPGESGKESGDGSGGEADAFPLPVPGRTAVASSGPSADKHPGLLRALALFRLDMRIEAVREWNWALRGRDETFRLAAARLALSNHLYDRCITSAELANPSGAWELRYLTPFREIIAPHAAAKHLDIDWIYGIMRQESRFVIPSRSSSGAQGLMQVMPRTAKYVAQQTGIYYHPGLLRDPETNVELGTGYMRIILDELDDNEVLAAAGYNAGPGRARKWRDGGMLEGAIYTETIPFEETRDYVKHVMTNAVIYAALRTGKPQSLKARLGAIGPKG